MIHGKEKKSKKGSRTKQTNERQQDKTIKPNQLEKDVNPLSGRV